MRGKRGYSSRDARGVGGVIDLEPLVIGGKEEFNFAQGNGIMGGNIKKRRKVGKMCANGRGLQEGVVLEFNGIIVHREDVD